MGWITILSKFGGLFNRLLGEWSKYDQKREQLRRQKRRASVAEDPERAFADLFGEPDSLSNHKSAKPAPLRSDAAKVRVEHDR